MGAFVVPLASEKTGAWKRWAGELKGPRSSEFASFNRKMGLTAHRAWLTELPSGPAVIVLTEGPGADRFLQRLRSESDPFATWFRERVTELHDLDPSKPLDDRSELHLDWQEAAAKV